MRRIAIALTLLLAAAACSDSTVEPDKGVKAKWPEASVDLAPRDQGLPDRADLAAPDLKKVDAQTGDVKPPDLPPPDLPPTPTWKAAKSGTSDDLHAVACQSYHVFAAGAKGTIIHSAPGAAAGGTFVKQQSNIASDLYTVTFAVDGKGKTYGAAAGNNAYIMETTDWGKKWDVAPQCSTYVFDTFYSLHLATFGKGLGAGVAVNKQGGAMKFYNSYSWVCSVAYKNEVMYDTHSMGKLGWTVGQTGGKIYYTVDEGVSWKSMTAPTKETLRAVTFATAKLGVAVGHKGTILTSTDGKGMKWTVTKSPVTVDLYDVFFRDAKSGWIAGDKGTILHTTDGGKTWGVQPTGVTTRLEAICFTSAKDGWAVGQKGTVLYTTTGGK